MQFLLDSLTLTEFNTLESMLAPQNGKQDLASEYALTAIKIVKPEKERQQIAKLLNDVQKMSALTPKPNHPPQQRTLQPPPPRIPEVDSYLNVRLLLYKWGIWD